MSVFVAMAVSLLFASGTGIPDLEVDAPPAMVDAAARLRWIPPSRLSAAAALVGVEGDPGPPIRVVLAPESSATARGTAPWISGFALAAESTVVLFPSRVPRYPDESLDALLVHEVTHVLVHRASGGRTLPRWLSEGIAVMAAKPWSLEDRTRVLLGGVGGAPDSVAELEEAFAETGRALGAAYAVAGALVHDLLREHGPDTVAETLDAMAAGAELEAAFESATGESLADATGRFWRRYRFWYRWVPLVTSGATLWLAITVLAVVAVIRKRQRRAAVEARWEAEEDASRRRRLDSLLDRFDDDVLH